MDANIIVSSPGKVILHGEHAVVYGKRALAGSLNLRTYMHVNSSVKPNVKITARCIGLEKLWSIDDLQKVLNKCQRDSRWHVSDAPRVVSESGIITKLQESYGNIESSEANERATVVFLCIYCSLALLSKKPCALDITMETELPIASGTGSSASFSVCVAASLLQVFGFISPLIVEESTSTNHWSPSDLRLIDAWAYEGEKIIHGTPSGLDNSVCTYGGVVSFCDGEITQLHDVPELSILLTNTGVTRSTRKLVADVRKLRDQLPDVIEPIFSAIGGISEKSVDILQRYDAKSGDLEDFSTLEKLVDLNQDLLRCLGVSHPTLDLIVSTGLQHGLHSKLTGAGGGGCAVTFFHSGQQEAVAALRSDLEGQGYKCWLTTFGSVGVSYHRDALNLPTLAS